MRPTLLPGLLQSLRQNLNHGTRDVCLFEIGRVFSVNQRGELPEEREAFAPRAGSDNYAERPAGWINRRARRKRCC